MNALTKSRAVRVLHLEDDREDQELVQALLEDSGICCEIKTVQTGIEFVSRLQNELWDIILADYALPSFDGFSALEMAHQLHPNIPFIFVTGTLGEDTVVESLKRGATDYVLKHKMERLGKAVQRALSESTERSRCQQAEEQLRFLVNYDALTGLVNRSALQERLSQALARARRSGEKVAVLFFDVDHFKHINDLLGHSIGDLVLKEVAGRLKKLARAEDTVSRLHGDEFVVVLTAVRDVAAAAVAADRILQLLATEFMVEGHSLSVSCSIGISLFPDHGTDGETLIKSADAAMYCAKENGRNNFRCFTQEINSRAAEQLTLENSLRLALERKQLFLEYQPELDCKTGKIVGAEALLRWRHPELGLIPPSKFIPIAENNGMIVPIGEWVLRTACAQAWQWQHEDFGPLPVAVNVSAVQFRQKRFLQVIRNVLDETGLPSQYLELELTERLLLPTGEVMLSVLRQLTDMGLKLSIDDFGTGYSSLTYLKHLPVYKLKIDRSFVQDLTVGSDDAAITATVINMGKTLNLKVIAEGVETGEQVRFLREHNCDEAQGYYFSKPLASDEFTDKARLNGFRTLIPMASRGCERIEQLRLPS